MLIDGKQTPSLILVEGNTYNFNFSSPDHLGNRYYIDGKHTHNTTRFTYTANC